jgi:hypothetical protein
MGWFTCKKSAEEIEVIEYVRQKKREDEIASRDKRIKDIVYNINHTIKAENRAWENKEDKWDFSLTCMIPLTGITPTEITYTAEYHDCQPPWELLIHPDITHCKDRLIAGYILHRYREELLYLVSGK